MLNNGACKLYSYTEKKLSVPALRVSISAPEQMASHLLDDATIQGNLLDPCHVSECPLLLRLQ